MYKIEILSGIIKITISKRPGLWYNALGAVPVREKVGAQAGAGSAVCSFFSHTVNKAAPGNVL